MARSPGRGHTQCHAPDPPLHTDRRHYDLRPPRAAAVPCEGRCGFSGLWRLGLLCGRLFQTFFFELLAPQKRQVQGLPHAVQNRIQDQNIPCSQRKPKLKHKGRRSCSTSLLYHPSLTERFAKIFTPGYTFFWGGYPPTPCPSPIPTPAPPPPGGWGGVGGVRHHRRPNTTSVAPRVYKRCRVLGHGDVESVEREGGEPGLAVCTAWWHTVVARGGTAGWRGGHLERSIAAIVQ